MIRRLLVVILLAAPLYAQEKPKIEPVPHFNRRAFIAGVSLLAASKTADAIHDACGDHWYGRVSPGGSVHLTRSLAKSN